ncbi:MAG: hypothetical protein ACPL3A_10050 [Thermoanaerobacteraceae bacterium]
MCLKKNKRSSRRIYLSIANRYRNKERGHTRTVTIGVSFIIFLNKIVKKCSYVV